MKYEVTYKINKTYLCSIEVEASSPNEAILEAQSLSGEELENGIADCVSFNITNFECSKKKKIKGKSVWSGLTDDQFMTSVLGIFPNAEIHMDDDGQLLIHTGLDGSNKDGIVKEF